MRFINLSIKGLFLINPDVHVDNRGAFRRNFCAEELKENGIEISVYQGNISENTSAFTMRGFHYQKSPSKESKLITPVSGGIYNVVIDLRPNSETFLNKVSLEVSSLRRESLYVPAGCANAFLTMEADTVVQYYMGDYFRPESYFGFRYNDPYFNVKWPHLPVVISDRDATFPDFSLEQL